LVLQEYVDGILDEERKNDFILHLNECQGCADYVAQMQTLRKTLREMPEIETSDSFHLLLRERIRREMSHQKRRMSFAWTLSHQIVPATALVAVVVLGSVWIIKDRAPFTGSTSETPMALQTEAHDAPRLDPSRYKNVRYVLDEYNPAVSLDRKDVPVPIQNSTRDSLSSRQRKARVQPRATQVSF